MQKGLESKDSNIQDFKVNYNYLEKLYKENDAHIDISNYLFVDKSL